METEWEERDSFFILKSAQLTEDWHKFRTMRITSSRIGSLVGHNKFTSSKKIALEMACIEKPHFTVNQELLMSRGSRLEGHVRDWYSKMIDKPINTVSLIVPKWDKRFGASVDGVIGDNMDEICEIKVPSKMYIPLKYRELQKFEGLKFDEYDHSHIWDSHYDQMQLGMAVTGAKFCHYIIYVPSFDNEKIPLEYYTEIIPFNQKYWEELYKEAVRVYEDIKTPHDVKRIDP